MADIIITAVIALICVLIIRSQIKKRKSGGCSCGCGECSMNSLCHDKYKKHEKKETK